ncbi:MAG: Gfo/Idh/MocA family oxidoreductase [Sphingomonas sp.]|uniref:Gfo/Idh/MocA family protein n=1 Tax=Sphingomonas sp. TaxID=28214 RepID=UPI001ACC087E|nr:Gfo/Idh/MocA family oxidoreductase [Sphingomonas sp.]MBN8816498.1 Gfo/Idh/MocA family oxidoreductase [Sphingomonas sp.]
MTTAEKKDPVRIGVVGLGMAGTIMIPVILAHPATVLAGACDLSADLRESFARDFSCPVTESAEELFARSDIDAVYIATPHQFHCENVKLAASYGKHVIVEKPMALTLPDCDAMIAAAEAAGTVLVVGHSHGFDSTTKLVSEIVASGRLGRLRMILTFNYTDFVYRFRRPEELDTSLGGGIIFNQIPHQIDFVRTVAGGVRVTGVSAVTGQFDPGRPTEGAMMSLLELEGGIYATLVYSGYDHFDSDELHGWIGEGGQTKEPRHGKTRAQLRSVADPADEAAMRGKVYSYGGSLWKQLGFRGDRSDHPHFGMAIVTCERGDIRPVPGGAMVYGDGGPEFVKLDPPRAGGGRSEVLDELCAAVRDGQHPMHDGAFGRETLRACSNILLAAAAGLPDVGTWRE